ncbi:hypothetical protein B0H10DRAFT_219496 [Mycena sp. CBHHK59/15]|nr:hypothetical protein B0H10DRAFT_219496 [Mycena sp. CBHHK59/15]
MSPLLRQFLVPFYLAYLQTTSHSQPFRPKRATVLEMPKWRTYLSHKAAWNRRPRTHEGIFSGLTACSHCTGMSESARISVKQDVEAEQSSDWIRRAKGSGLKKRKD